jgi:beta-ribofuranosylaminobenzene 5'-phosphate synthase
VIRVETGSRIHLGLIEPTGRAARTFGGCGFLVDEPRIAVIAEQLLGTRDDRIEGPLSERVAEFVRRYRAATPKEHPRSGVRIVVESCPDAHVGLGTGTQLGISVARALAELEGQSVVGATELAERIGRGRRSAIGVHGFDHGGFIVDGGRPRERSGGISPLIARHPVPESWRVAIFVPRNEQGFHGQIEEKAFDALGEEDPRRVEGFAERLSRILLLEILPALVEQEFRTFARAIGEFGSVAGEFFRPAQGDVFASPQIRSVVEALADAGFEGAGQSSWGPAVWALAENEREAWRAIDAVRARFRDRLLFDVVTRVRKHGATVASDRDRPIDVTRRGLRSLEEFPESS